MNKEAVRVLETGIIYRNPAPHVVSRHAYFPSVACGPGGALVATFVIGEAFESVDADTYTSISADTGLTWSRPMPLWKSRDGLLASNCARITSLGEDGLVAIMVRSDRSAHPDEGLANPKTMGFAPTALWLFRRGLDAQE